MASAVAMALPELAGTIQVVDQGGKVLTTTKSVFNAFKDAKAAYHSRKAQILAERNMEREKRDALKLATLEKEVRRQERQKKRIEHDKKKADRKEIEASGVKSIEWKDGDKSKDKKVKDKKEKDKDSKSKDRKREKDDGVLVVYDGDKKEKEKKDRKHRHHSSKDKDKKRKDSTSSEGDLKALATISTPPLTPADEGDLDFLEDERAENNQLSLPYNASVMSLAPALLQNVPGGAQARQILGFGHQMAAMMDPDGDSPLTALLVRLTDILDTFDCLNASITTLVVSLQKDPDALAMVGLTLAEIAAIVAKTAPGVVVAAKATFPVIFGMLASPQFLVTAGASVIVIGGYQIIRRVTGYGAAPAPPTPKAIEEEDHLAFGPGMDDVHSESEDAAKVSSSGAKIQAQIMHAPAPVSPDKKEDKKEDKKAGKKKVLTFPPSPPLTPVVEARKELVRSNTTSSSSSGAEVKTGEAKESRPKLLREGSKRFAIKNLLTRSNTMS